MINTDHTFAPMLLAHVQVEVPHPSLREASGGKAAGKRIEKEEKKQRLDEKGAWQQKAKIAMSLPAHQKLKQADYKAWLESKGQKIRSNTSVQDSCKLIVQLSEKQQQPYQQPKKEQQPMQKQQPNLL
jgi:hypothetical protein